MKVEIWSDIMCPFCYMGKRKFENALQQFAHKNEIEIKWRSFQLDPQLRNENGTNIHQYLAERKNLSVEKARNMNAQVTVIAKEVGLNFEMDKAVPANTFDAHRLTHLAGDHNLQDAAEERIFSAYFTEGKDIADSETLIQLGNEIGLSKDAVKRMLDSDVYANEVRADESEAQQLNIRGVPFFVIDRKYAVSGAQSSEVFLQALQTGWKEYEKENLIPTVKPGSDINACSMDGNCR